MTTFNPNTFNVQDANLTASKALPNSNVATAATAGFDLQPLTTAANLSECELLLSVPALVTAKLPDTATMTYTVQMDSDSAFGSATTLATLIVQTGASGAGAAAATARYRFPTTVERYVRVLATPAHTSTIDASAVSMTAKLLF